MTVYAQTEEGHRAAFNPDSALPRKLRSFLVLVDGKTPSEAFASQLSAFGDVEGVLQSLHHAGLIYPQSSRAMDFADTSPLSAVSPFKAIGKEPAGAFKANVVSAWEPLGPETHTFYMQTRQEEAANDPATHAARSQALANAVALMTEFVAVQEPEHASELLQECQQLISLEQLAVTLGGYEQRIAHLGVPAHGHILSIKRILREHM
jgi:hypothetical protein